MALAGDLLSGFRGVHSAVRGALTLNSGMMIEEYLWMLGR